LQMRFDICPKLRKPEATFAVYVPVGPSSLESGRVRDLLESLACYEPAVSIVVLIDHGPSPRDFSHLIATSVLPIKVLRHCSQTDRGTWLGAGCVTNLVAIDYISSRQTVEFILKLDTDALVIGPFSQKVASAFYTNPNWGIAGTLGESSNRALRTFKFDAETKALLDAMLDIGRRVMVDSELLDNWDIAWWNLFTESQKEHFVRVSDEIQNALSLAYTGQHCQGGAYAVSRAFIARIRAAGLLDNPTRWLYVPIGEDRMMGVTCAGLGLALGDFSADGEPFGVQNIGLPYETRELTSRGYSIVHSLRNNLFADEQELRRYFRQLRGHRTDASR
jgi:hypothetical protein